MEYPALQNKVFLSTYILIWTVISFAISLVVAPLVALPFGFCILFGAISGYLFGILAIFLWSVVKYADYSAQNQFQRMVSYLALALVSVGIWIGFTFLMLYICMPENNIAPFEPFIPLELMLGCCFFIIVLVTYNKMIEKAKESEKEEELEEIEQTIEQTQPDVAVETEMVERVAVKVGSKIEVIMSMAIGMVVDDAIVVLENITKHIERGSSPREAAIYATNEVWLAVIMATLVVVAVFMPLTFVSGITGVIFNQLGWIVSITVVVSTVAAVTITPMLAARFMKVREKKENPKKYSYDATIGKWLDNLDIWYEKVLHWALEHKLRVILVSAGIFIGSLCLTPWVATDFMSQNDESRLTIKAELAPGTRMQEPNHFF